MSEFDQLRMMGKDALDASRDWLTKPIDAAARFTEALVQTVSGGADLSGLPQAVQQTLYMNALISGRWAMCGFPTVVIGHRAAAAFCATRMKPADAADFVRCPWPAFVIRLPTGLLTVEDRGVMREASCIAVTCLEPHEVTYQETHPQPGGQARWWWKLLAPATGPRPKWAPPWLSTYFLDGISLWGFNMATHYMATEDAGASDLGYTRWETQPTVSSDERSEKMARALILATCLYLSGDPREREQRASEGGVTVRERKSKVREGDDLPQYTSYEVQSSIRINLHHAIREYIDKGGSAPSVQTLVAGHWKRVAFGQGRTQRRLQHIQPYWRGDVDAPVSVRTK